MPLDSKVFNIINATPENIAKLNLSLQYLSLSENASDAFTAVATKNVKLQFVETTPSMWTHSEIRNGEKIIFWDPAAALVIRDDNGTPIGVESAAQLLRHEVAHMLDNNLAVNNSTLTYDKYDNVADRIAIIQEGVSAAELGEVIRTNHAGEFIYEYNPTQHSVGNDYHELLESGMYIINQNMLTLPEAPPYCTPMTEGMWQNGHYIYFMDPDYYDLPDDPFGEGWCRTSNNLY